MTGARWSIVGASILTGFAMGLLILASSSLSAENLAVFEVRVDGKTKTWSLAQVQKLPPANFTNRQGKGRPAVLLSTLLERSGVPMERTAAVTVTGLGGDTKKGPATKGLPQAKPASGTTAEFTGQDLRQILARVVIFFNPDKHWTVASLEHSGPSDPWDETRVRKVRRIDVTLN